MRERNHATFELNEALSALAVQGVAFIDVPSDDGQRTFVVDRVRLKESELVYLLKHGALNVRGICQYLLNRVAA